MYNSNVETKKLEIAAKVWNFYFRNFRQNINLFIHSCLAFIGKMSNRHSVQHTEHIKW